MKRERRRIFSSDVISGGVGGMFVGVVLVRPGEGGIALVTMFVLLVIAVVLRIIEGRRRIAILPSPDADLLDGLERRRLYAVTLCPDYTRWGGWTANHSYGPDGPVDFYCGHNLRDALDLLLKHQVNGERVA